MESVNDGLFHSVELLIQNRSLSLVVDSGAPKSLGKLARQPSVDHNTQLYIGGTHIHTRLQACIILLWFFSYVYTHSHPQHANKYIDTYLLIKEQPLLLLFSCSVFSENIDEKKVCFFLNHMKETIYHATVRAAVFYIVFSSEIKLK